MAPRKTATQKTAARKTTTRKTAAKRATAPATPKPKPKSQANAQPNAKAQAKRAKPATDKPTRTTKSTNLLNRSARSLWPKSTELVSLEFQVYPLFDCELYPQYTIGLHAWFLEQIRAFDPELSAYMHDGGSEKPFSLTGLNGLFTSHSQALPLQKSQSYQWRINSLSQRVTQGLATWLRQLPDEIDLKNAPLAIESVSLAQPATTYAKLLRQGKEQLDENSLSLSFTSPTSFKRKGHHLPLPWPTNVFHSYLRRWNHFAKKQIDQDAFLEWIDTHVIISRHQIESCKVAAGKRGSVTGFTGAVTYTLDYKAAEQADYHALFYSLVQLAPYCGTGHKTTFGLGETQLGWQGLGEVAVVPVRQQVLAARIDELTALFLSQRKRKGGDRAQHTAATWATILARREQGDGLGAISQAMDLPYETAKTYSKLARRALREKKDDE